MQYKYNLAGDKRNTDIRRDLDIRTYLLCAVPQFCFSLQLRGFFPLDEVKQPDGTNAKDD